MTENSDKHKESREQGFSEVINVKGMFENWFLDYASYVILERAVPGIGDGLKPVQRRIMHALHEMDDGRFHKVANVIGQTMQYHPHGDAAIGDALVKLGQKDLLLDTQGNWGDIRTGDSSAAPRYIETRLSKFAKDVVFNKDTTEWQLSYDGRKSEPIHLPVKFPLLLAQGTEGIAVGLSTKILPHNFCELIQASISVLKGRNKTIYPDFVTGGMIDVSEYKDGKRGGKVKLRSTIEIQDKRTLIIKDIPYYTTTTSLIDSIVKANDKGKIKIKKVTDNTAADVNIEIELPSGVSPEVTMDALYAFTQCEMSVSPITCVIVDNKPHFLSVSEVLKMSTDNTVDLLKQELEIKKERLEERWHFSSLEKIFIENRIYRDIEECETWEAVIEAIDKGLKPHVKKLKRKVTEEDIVRLTEIRIKRISKFDSFKADELIKGLEAELKQVKHDLKHLTEFAIAYFENLLKKYGEGKERKTKIMDFEDIKVRQVVVANKKLFVDRKNGFVGHGLRGVEQIGECSELDLIVAFKKDGTCKVVKVANKVFVGKNIIHTSVWKKGDDRTVYHMIYTDPKLGKSFVKRFNLKAVTQNKDYQLTTGNDKCKVVYFSVQPNGESEVIKINLSTNARARIKEFEYDFAELGIKGRGSRGNVITKYGIRKVTQLEVGESTIGGLKLWIDKASGRLNKNERGELLGEFNTGDQILAIYKTGEYELTDFELTNRYDPEKLLWISKHDEKKPISAAYYDGEKKTTFIKRFLIETSSQGQKFNFTSEAPRSVLYYASDLENPTVEVHIQDRKTKRKKEKQLNLAEFIDVKGWKSVGNKFTDEKVLRIIGVGKIEDGSEEINEDRRPKTEVQGSQQEADQPLAEKSKDKGRKTKSQSGKAATKKTQAKPSAAKKVPAKKVEEDKELKQTTSKAKKKGSNEIEWEVKSSKKKGDQGELFE